MAFFSYLLGNNEQPQDGPAPPAYEYVSDEDVKCGSVAGDEKPHDHDDNNHGRRKPCDPCHKPKPCDPCHKPKPCDPCPKPPRPHCEPLPPPPKPCCTPCPPRPPKPCPKPCPKPQPCRKPCDPCRPKPPHHGSYGDDSPQQGGDDNQGQVGWDNDDVEKAIGSDIENSNGEGCHKPQPVCIYNACNLVIWVSLNLLFIAIAFVAAVTQPTVNVLVVIFLAINLAINFLGLAGLYNNCAEYIQLASWWQWISVPVSLFLAWQTFSQGIDAVIALLQASSIAILVTIGDFLQGLANNSPTLANLFFAAIFVGYAIGLIVFAFEWAQAACARCVIVDCEDECGWFKTIVDLIGGLIPIPTSVITIVFDVLASLCDSGIFP